ncbi:hypothetical protein LguiB_034667 [Lonicera macranthoides]
MLAGCSSTLLSPRHRLRSEASAQFQACHYPSMSTQRLDLPCTFPQKPTSRSQPVRPVGLSVDTQIEARTSGCSLKHNVSAQASFLEGTRRQNLKRFAEQGSFEDEPCTNRAKRKRVNQKPEDDDSFMGQENLSLGQLGSGNFWFQQPSSSPLFTRLNQPQIPRSVPLLTDLGEKNAEPSEGRPSKEPSGSSSTSSETHRLALRLIENIAEQETGNGSRPPNPNESREIVAGGQDSHEEHDGFELVSLLMACVDAIGSKNIAAINHFIAKLGELASPRGGSSISRLAAYFTEALAIRVARFWPHIFHINAPRELNQVDEDSGSALRLLNQVSPIPKFIHFTSNEIILRSFEGKDRVHIIDFDIKQGLQWPSLFQSLASRGNPPSHVRITGIGESKQELVETGERLSGFADALNLQFEFHPVVDRLEDVRLWMLHVKEKETVAVNCVFQLHKMLYDGTGGALRDFLGLIRSTNPAVVLMAEQEAEHNEAGLEKRLSNSLKYYSALFDSLDSVLPLESPVRINIEEMFGREIRNIVACEGRDRFSRHEGFEEWRRLMEGGVFRCIGISEREFMQSQMLLKMYSCENYRVEKKVQQGDAAAGLTLSWLDQPLYTVSAWAPMDFAGSSSSYSQPN